MEDLVQQENLNFYDDEIIDTIRNYNQDSRMIGYKFKTIKGCCYLDKDGIYIFSIDNSSKNNGVFSEFIKLLLEYNCKIVFKNVINDRLRKHLIAKYNFKTININDVCYEDNIQNYQNQKDLLF